MLTALSLIAKLMLYIGALVSIGILSHFCLGIQQKLKGLRVFGHTQGAENMPWLPLWVVPHSLIAGFWIWAPISLWPSKAAPDCCCMGCAASVCDWALFAMAAKR